MYLSLPCLSSLYQAGANRRQKGTKGRGREAHPAAAEAPGGRRALRLPLTAARPGPGSCSAALLLLSSSTSSSSSSSPSLKGESGVRRRERNLGRCVGCPEIGWVLAIKMKSKKGSCDGSRDKAGAPAARGGKGKGGCRQASRSPFAFLAFCPPCPPWPVSRGRLQWMLRSQTKHAGLLFGGGRLSAPLAPCQKHV